MKFFDFGEVINSDTEFVIFGIPWDYLTSIPQSSSSLAPDKIRDVSINLGLTTERGYEIPKLKVVDIGNVKIEPTEIKNNLNEIENFIKEIYKQNEKVSLIMIGGDHFCSYPVIKAVGDNLKKKSDFGVLIFDAHLDLYNKYDKGEYSHATIAHRVYDLEYINNKNLIIVGTRDIDIPEMKIADNENIFHMDAYRLMEEGMDNYINNIVGYFQYSNVKEIYVSIDIDVFDPSSAPGTGYAIPGGFSYREIWKILKELTKKFNILALDLVEVSPNLDLKNYLTCNLGAKLIIEFISFITDKYNKD